MNTLMTVLITLISIVAVGGASWGAFALGVGKFFSAMLDRRRKAIEDRMAQAREVREAERDAFAKMRALATGALEQLKAAEERNLSTEQRLEREIATLNKKMKILEDARDALQERVDELELENDQLKRRLYDLEHPGRPRTTRKTAKITRIPPPDHA